MSTYIMEDPREAGRLEGKVDPDVVLERYLRPHLDGTRDVLDVGCGPAVITRAIGAACPDANVVGLDASEARLAVARENVACLPNVSLKCGTATDLPFESDSFDVVFCRFLLEYLPDRQKAVSEMARVCRPGGKVILQDLDGQLVSHWPDDAELQRPLEKVLDHLRTTGFDPFVGRKLYSLAKSAGLTHLQVSAESYHLYAGRIDDHNYALWEAKLDSALPVAARALGGPEAALDLKVRFLEYLRREDTLTYSVIFTVCGRKAG
jgi:ubiquinone/menaquinone biosynthesis C-methylase UbiE